MVVYALFSIQSVNTFNRSWTYILEWQSLSLFFQLKRKEEQEQEQDLSCKTRQNADLEAPLLESLEDHQPDSTEKETASTSESDGTRSHPSACYHCKRIVQCLELPLSLPRMLTIPDVSKEKWSKPSAVASVTLAPLLLAVLVTCKRKDAGSEESLSIYISGGLVGLVLGIVCLVKTEKERPPTRFLFPWLAGGFLMSVTWTYIIAQELVSLLVSLGTVMEISSSILGLTVLAWGNSVGDLIASSAVALHDRQGGTQVAMSGCYGGPIFNTLVGLGLSFVFSSWSAYPSPVVIPKDLTLYQTMGFLIGGLLWALVILPRRGMRLDRVLGSGLLSIYFCSLSLRMVQSLGLV
nr:PREDICTED: cation/calcium exchanger 1-like isoform X2 [Musa acuminata subsp. malaccensis]